MTVPEGTLVQITAPKDMPAGFVFDAEVDGKTFPVTVPTGGVQAGQVMQVPYPTTAVEEKIAAPAETAVTTVSQPVPTQQTQSLLNQAPQGQWRNKMCECWDVCCTARCFMACCCYTSCCFLGQLLQRMKLDAFGQTTRDASNTCVTISVGIAILYVASGVVNQLSPDYAPLINLVGWIWILVAGTCMRMHFRRKYKIPSTCCGEGCCGDCCCMCWCGCCNMIQMSRHTHDEHLHEYDCCSKTGLAPDAPEVV